MESFKWENVVQPAVDLALNGFTVDQELYKRYQDTVPKAPSNSYLEKYFGSMQPGQVFK